MKHILKYLAGVLGTVLVLLLVYGLIEPRLILDERRETAAIPALPQQWEDAEIAVLADLQIGMWWANTGMVERAVETVVEEQPDAVLLGGDFVYSSSPSIPEQVDTVLELLRPIVNSGIPTVAVLGNHDYEVGAEDELTTALEDAGIRVLSNEAVALPAAADSSEDQQLHVVGIGPARPGLDDVDAAMADLPDTAPRVVLMHNPTTYPKLPAGSAPLAVAGHTHCGQIALPSTPEWSWIGLTEEEQIVVDGFAPQDYGAAGNSMFVTCGIGFSVIPVRIGAAPQVVFFELTAAD